MSVRVVAAERSKNPASSVRDYSAYAYAYEIADFYEVIRRRKMRRREFKRHLFEYGKLFWRKYFVAATSSSNTIAQ